MSLYSSLSVSPEEPLRTTRGVRFGVDSSPLETSGESEESIDILMRELRESVGPNHGTPHVQMALQERASQDQSQVLLALQEENRGQTKQIHVLDLKLKQTEEDYKTSEGNLHLARLETERLNEVVLQRDAALQQIRKQYAQPGSQIGHISKLEGELGRSQEAVRSFREQLEQEQRQRCDAGGKVSQLLGINAHLKEQMEGYLTRAREAEQLTIAAEELFRRAREEAEVSARAAKDALEVSNLAWSPPLGVFMAVSL